MPQQQKRAWTMAGVLVVAGTLTQDLIRQRRAAAPRGWLRASGHHAAARAARRICRRLSPCARSSAA